MLTRPIRTSQLLPRRRTPASGEVCARSAAFPQTVPQPSGSVRTAARRSLGAALGSVQGRAFTALTLLLGLALPAAAVDIANTAAVELLYDGTPRPVASNTVIVVAAPAATDAVIGFLHFGPDPGGAPLPATDYSSSDPPATPPASSWIPLAAFPDPGQTTPAASYPEGERVVVEVRDFDQNLDPTAIDTVSVRLYVAASGDLEWLRLYETGPNTGIFRGSLPAGNGAATLLDGFLSAPGGALIELSYADNGGTLLSASAPVVAAGGSLFLRKEAAAATTAVGEALRYTLALDNASPSATATAVTVSDRLPAGFRYLAGSARRDGTALADPALSADGRTLTFLLGDLPPGASVRLDYAVRVGAGARPGPARNEAVASSPGAGASNVAAALVAVRDDFMRNSAIVAGRVLSGEACGGELRGLAGVRLFLEDGTFVVTDREGRYHLEGVSPGNHVLRLDESTLPPGYEAALCEDHTRFAGTANNRFLDLRGGTLWRADFYATPKMLSGEVSIALDNAFDGGERAVYRVDLAGSDLPVRNLLLRVTLPAPASYLPGSATLDGAPLPDPVSDGDTLLFPLPDQTPPWRGELRFDALIDPDAQTGELRAGAWLGFDSNGLTGLATPVSESLLVWIARRERLELNEVLLQARFDTLEATLSAADEAQVAAIAEQLRQLDIVHLFVIGHTDARRIRWRDGIVFRDNQELSEARAGSVAAALARHLDLAPELVTVRGMAESEPVTGNDTLQGMATNRRTELRVIHRISTTIPAEAVAAEPGALRSVAASVPQVAPAAAAAPLAQGILFPRDGQALAHSVESVRVRYDARLTPELTLDGVVLPAERIGFTLKEEESRTQLATWVGIDLGAPGEHVLRFRGRDPFGNVRLDSTVRIVRLGPVHSIRARASEGNVADGRTPLQVALDLADADGRRIPGTVKLEIRGGDLIPLGLRQRALPGAPERTLVEVDGDGVARFEPVTQAGLYQLVLGYGEAEERIELFVHPEEREWLVVGLAEGTLTRQSLSGDQGGAEAAGLTDDLSRDGRVALYATGPLGAGWQATVAYDSDKPDQEGTSLFQTVDPDRYYPLYGDTTAQGYDAASGDNLYARIERERFMAMYGDYNSGLIRTELGRYSRSLTGYAARYEGRAAGFTLFASDTGQGFRREELRGDGTSGLYRLAAGPLVLNSEKITLEVRDRFHSERVLSQKTLQRHLDYAIDSEAGTLWFKEPVASRDAEFNPVWIVVEYETRGSDASWIAGGRPWVRLLGDRLELGVTGIHEGVEGAEATLGGFDLSARLTRAFSLRLEGAYSTRETLAGDAEGSAWLTELLWQEPNFSGRLYAREQEPEFGLGHQNAAQGGTRKVGGDATAWLTRAFALNAELFREENLASDLTRTVAAGTARYRQPRFGLEAGLREAVDEAADGSEQRSLLALAGGDVRVSEQLTLQARHEQALASDDANPDYPSRTLLGADFAVTRGLSLFAAQEFTHGEGADTASTRLGLNAAPWDGAQVRTSVENRRTEEGDRLFANYGLLQRWQVTARLGLDLSLDRSETLSGSVAPSFHPDQPPASGASEDFTALSAGSSYRGDAWLWDNRAEYRTSDSEERYGLFSGYHVEPRADLGLSSRALLFLTRPESAGNQTRAELRFGLAWRPADRSWILLDRLDLVHDDAGDDRAWRAINLLNAHWRVNQPTRIAFQAGAKYVAESVLGVDARGVTTLCGAELRRDLGRRFDIGAHADLLQSWEPDQAVWSTGLNLGFSPVKNTWLSAGYNFTGFEDRDFSAAGYTAQGPFLRFRVKFDEQSMRDAAALFTRR